MKKIIIGIVFFLAQISLAIFYNGTIDLKIVIAISLPVFAFILYKYFSGKYDSCEI